MNTCVYRLVQEALHNCEKHSAATRVRVAVRQLSECLVAEVEDNGRGFRLNEAGMPSRRRGLGLLGMRERVSGAGGTMVIDSSPGNGTRFAFRFRCRRGQSGSGIEKRGDCIMPVRILLADDHAMMRQGLRHILETDSEFDIVAEASSGIEAVELARLHKPDVAVVDVAMKELNGIETTSQILRHSPQTAVLILSMYSDERYVVRAVKAGARGYVLKNSAGDELIEAIHNVQKGLAFFSPEVAQIFQEGFTRLRNGGAINDRYELLTDRERQIYQLLAEGNSNKDIAHRLNLSLTRWKPTAGALWRNWICTAPPSWSSARFAAAW